MNDVIDNFKGSSSAEEIKDHLAWMEDEGKWKGSDLGTDLINMVDQPSLILALATISLAAVQAVLSVRDEFLTEEEDEDHIATLNEHVKSLLPRCILTPETFTELWEEALNDEWQDASGGVINPFDDFYVVFEVLFQGGGEDIEMDFNEVVKERLNSYKLSIDGDKVKVDVDL